MKTLFKRLETIMAAAAFAEEGEFTTARQLMNENRPRKTNRPQAYNDKRPVSRNEMRAD
ncbi:MAG TPA: hypothetical protein VK654_04330 [Nitrospirota bacterium]|nr:hypothetical protein [Nitrospirota bacterium]